MARAPSPLLLASLLLAACPPVVSDDDDSATPDDGLPPDGADGDVPCDPVEQGSTTADVWRLGATGTLRVVVDTLTDVSSFDPTAYVTTDGAPTWSSAAAVALGTDDAPCTAPPSAGQCPDFEATVDGAAWLVIFGKPLGCNASGTGWYTVQVTLDGAPVGTELEADDVAVSLPF
jgi:hypothetical protein